MKQFITLGALALAWAVLQTVLFSARPLEKLTLVQAQALPNAIWIDARNPLEYSQEHIPGALNLPLRDALQGTIPQQLRDTDKSLVIYCDGVTCGASDRVAEILSKTLHARIYVLPGGFPEWKAAR